MTDFLTDYLHYTENTEPHKVYHRWSALISVSAMLGRSVYIPFGHSKLYANLYGMLLGEPGARKSTAIKMMKRTIMDAGYEKFAADRSSREKFLLDLDGSEETEDKEIAKRAKNGEDVTSLNLWGSSAEREPAEVFIVADEFNEFVSAGNVDFYTTLGNLWDWDNERENYEDRVKNSKSVSIYQPTISLLGGNTQENFARAFPPEILGHGFLTRLLLIHGIPSGRKIARPKPPSEEASAIIITRIKGMQAAAYAQRGELLVEAEADLLLEKIYLSHPGISDPRFASYNNRRHTHLLKLCISTCFLMDIGFISEAVVVYANTMLSAVEAKMPESIGEFGKSKNSDVAHKILSILKDATAPVTVKQLWSFLVKDLSRMTELSELLRNLQVADKIQHVVGLSGKGGYLAVREVTKKVQYVDWSLISEEERILAGWLS